MKVLLKVIRMILNQQDAPTLITDTAKAILNARTARQLQDQPLDVKKHGRTYSWNPYQDKDHMAYVGALNGLHRIHPWLPDFLRKLRIIK